MSGTKVEGFLISLLVEVEVVIETAVKPGTFQASRPQVCQALLEGHVSVSVTDYTLFKGLLIPPVLGKHLMGNIQAIFKVLGWRFSSIKVVFFHIVSVGFLLLSWPFENLHSTQGFYVL